MFCSVFSLPSLYLSCFFFFWGFSISLVFRLKGRHGPAGPLLGRLHYCWPESFISRLECVPWHLCLNKKQFPWLGSSLSRSKTNLMVMGITQLSRPTHVQKPMAFPFFHFFFPPRNRLSSRFINKVTRSNRYKVMRKPSYKADQR